VAQLLMTGFPGFLGSALLPRLLARRPDTDAVCLVQPQHAVLARSRVKELEITDPHTSGRIRLVEGDITAAGLGLSPAERDSIGEVHEVWHLAAVYDLAVAPHVARRVNVGGTTNVLAFCREQSHLRRLQYVSTCYVSGRFEGEFTEDSLEVGQEFRNHYEETKYEAELLVRKAMADGIPATIYRPGIVVGDSQTGATQKYDGPYFLATFLARQVALAVVPAVGDADHVRVCLVPRDFVVGAMDELSVLDASDGRSYALVDPDPPTVREVVTTFARHRNTRVVWMPLPLGPVRALVEHVPGMERLLGLPAEALDYFASPTTYATVNTTRDLTASGLVCPPFQSYAGLLLDFMLAHPEYDANAMT
jgi:thioester reductase-like protein